MGSRVSPDGSLRITVTATEPLGDCPCTFGTGTLEYVVDFPDDRWEGRQATVTVESFTDNGDGTFAAGGTFGGTLSRPGGSADETLEVEGRFDVRRIRHVGRR